MFIKEQKYVHHQSHINLNSLITYHDEKKRFPNQSVTEYLIFPVSNLIRRDWNKSFIDVSIIPEVGMPNLAKRDKKT